MFNIQVFQMAKPFGKLTTLYRFSEDNSKPKRWQSEALPSFGFYVLSKAYIAIELPIKKTYSNCRSNEP